MSKPAIGRNLEDYGGRRNQNGPGEPIDRISFDSLEPVAVHIKVTLGLE